jgi:hypothetical protein
MKLVMSCQDFPPIRLLISTYVCLFIDFRTPNQLLDTDTKRLANYDIQFIDLVLRDCNLNYEGDG